ncbi:Exportin-1 [Cichlidogyrus casuarinus]|uniref:Exportin-1 n=1 Tax=Cichlidogyrus casuarinus TaxID=1844966 RepID=A0ABD2PV84_9PLAT
MFKTVETPGEITISMNPNAGLEQVEATVNVQFVNEALFDLLKNAFPHLQQPQITLFIQGLFSFDQDVATFREHVRDFLVQIREVAGEDLTDLYLEEREQDILKAQEEKKKKLSAVPGILNPNLDAENEMND